MSECPFIDNYETSPLRFELEVIVEEYRSLRAEITTRSANEQQIINFSITLIVGLLAATQLFPSFFQILVETGTIRIALLVISLLFSAMALLQIEIDCYMAFIAKYMQQILKPRVENIIAQTRKNISDKSSTIWEWENYRAKYQFHTWRALPIIFMSVGRYALTIVPAILVLCLYFSKITNVTIPFENNELEIILRYISIFGLTAVLLSALFNGVIFINLNKKPSDHGNINNQEDSFSSFRKNATKNFLLSDKFLLPSLTLLFGFIPMLVLSILSKSFWLSHQIDFPFLAIPSVFIGDSLFLPFFNYKYFSTFKIEIGFQKLKKYKQEVILMFVISFIISFVINSYTHLNWIHDPYQGFMDLVFGRLSTAGWVHFEFSVMEMTIILSLVGFSILFYICKNKNGFNKIASIWIIFVFYSSLSLIDFLFRNLIIFPNTYLFRALLPQWISFAQLYFALFWFILLIIGKRLLSRNN